MTRFPILCLLAISLAQLHGCGQMGALYQPPAQGADVGGADVDAAPSADSAR
ncbi:MAG: putative small lipoprotein YifL [Halieaceae bacterium]|jgi:predicted small lipoprotein YifL